MCTVSWQCQDQNLHLFCNRDEQRSRAPAIYPKILSSATCNYIAPTDPVGGGTWLAVNEYGFCATLLNAYPEPSFIPETPLSRGKIVTTLMQATTIDEASGILETLPLDVYRPFLVLLLSLYGGKQFMWNGRDLRHHNLDLSWGSVSTSSYLTREVEGYRNRLFKDLTDSLPACGTPEDLMEYHLHAEPGYEKRSIMVSRPETCTVSFSRLHIDGQQIVFDYYDQAPLGMGLPHQTTLKALQPES